MTDAKEVADLKETIGCLTRTMELLLSTAEHFERQASKGTGGRRGGPVFTKARAAIAKGNEALGTQATGGAGDE